MLLPLRQVGEWMPLDRIDPAAVRGAEVAGDGGGIQEADSMTFHSLGRP